MKCKTCGSDATPIVVEIGAPGEGYPPEMWWDCDECADDPDTSERHALWRWAVDPWSEEELTEWCKRKITIIEEKAAWMASRHQPRNGHE